MEGHERARGREGVMAGRSATVRLPLQHRAQSYPSSQTQDTPHGPTHVHAGGTVVRIR